MTASVITATVDRLIMTPSVSFKCRTCDSEIVINPAEPGPVRCPRCKQDAHVFMSESLPSGGFVTTCVSCGHDMFYVQKDFNRRAGLLLVGLGIAASMYFISKSEPLYGVGVLAL